MAVAALSTKAVVYERHRPERTTLYEVVRDNVETLYGAMDDGAIAVRIPQHAKKELEAYLNSGLLCRGFARLRAASVRWLRRELLRRTFAIDVLACPACNGRMKLVAMITEPRSIARLLAALGESTDVPGRSPNRGPPYWKSTIVRRQALGDAA